MSRKTRTRCCLCFALIPVMVAISGVIVRAQTIEFEGEQGELVYINTTYDPLQGIRINTWSETKWADPPVLPYLWVACSGRGTIVRIDTSTQHCVTGQQIEASGELVEIIGGNSESQS